MLRRPTGPMAPSATFALLYMLAIFIEHAERWVYPAYTIGILALLLAVLLTGMTRLGFLVFLLVTTVQLVVMQFPDVANHVNLILGINLLLICGLVQSMVRHRGPDGLDAWFVMMRPLLQLTLVLVYFLAGFHKLNADFINPDVSCVQRTISTLREAFRTSLHGVPAVLIIGVGIVGGGGWLLVGSPLRRHLARLGIAVLAVGVGAAFFALLPANVLPAELKASLAMPLIVVVLLWEVVGGLLLLVPALQLPVVVFSWGMHATLALVTFVDFGALALSLLFAFVPASYQDLIGGTIRSERKGWIVPRPHLYLAGVAVVGLLHLDSTLAAGIVFNAAVLILAWPLLSAAVQRTERLPWRGVPITLSRTPRWLLIFPALLVFHASSSYLGLRTAGNFSMFSNLRTEGERSNHLLLGGNPFRFFAYQGDVVRFHEIDDERARIGYQYQPLKGNALPVVEFRKLVHWWSEAGRTVPMTLEYRGVVHTTDDITNDPTWRSAGRDWEMLLMDFRVIQLDGPNRCRW